MFSHKKVERNVILMAVLILVTVSIGVSCRSSSPGCVPSTTSRLGRDERAESLPERVASSASSKSSEPDIVVIFSELCGALQLSAR